MNKSSIKNHQLCRPPKNAINVERLLKNGKWIPDDGKPGLAFSGESTIGNSHMLFPCAWSVDCSCNFSLNCPGYIALNYTSKRFKCANGRSVPPIAAKTNHSNES